MEPLTTLFDQQPACAHPILTDDLRLLYGGDLQFPLLSNRPYVIGNFVSTLDGVVSYKLPGKSGGGEISGFDEVDAFIMGLLRAYADAVMVASGTFHEDSGHVRTSQFIYPRTQQQYAKFRREVLKKPTTHPLNVIVTGRGKIDLGEPTFHTPGLQTLIVTTEEGQRQLLADHNRDELSTTQLAVVAERRTVPPGAILKLLREEFGVSLLLHEGGPTLMGEFLVERLIDELFLTLAPQIAGRSGKNRRPGLAEEATFFPDRAPWFELVSIKRGGSHVFLRYRS